MFDKDIAAAFPFLKHGIWQIGILVEDLNKAVEAYWKLCGIGPWQMFTYQKPFVKWMTYRGNPAEYKMRVALARIGPQQLELIEPLEGPSIYAEFVAQRGYGLHHIGILVDDLDVAIEQAEEAGYPVIQSGGGHGLDGDGGYAYLDTEAKFDAIIELMTPPKRRAKPEQVYPPESAA